MSTAAPVLLTAALAGAAAAVLVGAPRAGPARLAELTRRPVLRRAQRLRHGLLLLPLPVVLLLGPVPAALALAALVLGRRWSVARGRARAREAERLGAVEACGVLAAELRAGRAPAEALAASGAVARGPSREALLAAASAARLGGDVPGALAGVDAGSAVPDVLRALGACWSVCSRSGAGLAAAVERLEEGLRAEQAQRRALDAELAGPRATAGLLAVLPVVGLVLAAGMGADPLRVLLHTPLGLVCLVTGLALDGLGVLWTRRLAARAAAGG